MSYLIDSDWLIDVLVGAVTAVGIIERLSGQELAVSVISYGELFGGRSAMPTRGRNWRAAARCWTASP